MITRSHIVELTIHPTKKALLHSNSIHLFKIMRAATRYLSHNLLHQPAMNKASAHLKTSTLSKLFRHSSFLSTNQPPSFRRNQNSTAATDLSNSAIYSSIYSSNNSFSRSKSSHLNSISVAVMTPALLLHSANIPSSSVFDNRRFSTISFTKEEVVDMEEEKVGPTSNLDNDAAALNIVESINRLTDPSIMSQKGRLKLEVAQIIEEFGGDEFNSGLTEVQIAILTRKIAYISLFLRENRKDKHNIRSLNLMIGRRRKLLKYLIRQSRSRYFSTINALGLRDIYGDKVLKRKGARKKYPPSNLKKF